MRILIIGAGGREHALAVVYSKSKKVKMVFVAPGNDLISFKNPKIKTIPEISTLDFPEIIDFCKKQKIDLVDVACDDPLAGGLVDILKEKNINVFGPSKKASEIEWNKVWARDFMKKYHLPTPVFKSFSNEEDAIKYVKKIPNKTLYIKAAGLATGKGAIRAETKEEAVLAIKKMKDFGKAGKTFVIEECVEGKEFSFFIVTDGKNYKVVKAAQDHKTVYEKNKGPNTGGMGCVSPVKSITPLIIRKIEKEIIKPFIIGMQKEKRGYQGILYLGGMLTYSSGKAGSGQADGVKIIEFNARWGDPEAEVILPSIKTDYFKIALAVINGTIDKLKIEIDNKTRISVAGCSAGYPNDYSRVKGKEIFRLDELTSNNSVKIFGAGIKIKNNKFLANGGRIFHLVSEGKNIIDARKKAYQELSSIYIEGNNLHYRTDIGWQEMEKI